MLSVNLDKREMRMSGIIGEDFTADEVFEALGTLDGSDITINLNSPGGIVPEGNSIYNQLKDYSGNIAMRIDAQAASMASVIMLAGDTIEAHENANIMIHNPWVVAMGDAAELREVADMLDAIGLRIAGMYAAKTGKSADYWIEAMTPQSIYSAAEAMDEGLISGVIENVAEPQAAADRGILQPVAALELPRRAATRATVQAQQLRQRMIDTGHFPRNT